MHKVKKYLLITALVTLATGLTTAGIGQAMGGLDKTQDYFQEQANSYPRKTKTFKDIKEVQINSDNQFVEVVENTDASNKDFILSYQDTSHAKVSFSEQGRKLKVTNTIKSGYYGASSLFDRSLAGKPFDNQKILLTVPQGTNLETISIQVDNGEITLEKIQAKEVQLTASRSSDFDSFSFIDISQSSFEKGNISSEGVLGMRVTDSQLKETHLYTDNGRIDFDKVSLENTHIETDTGTIEGNIRSLKGTTSIENGFGQTSLSLAQALQKTTTLNLSNEEGSNYLNSKSITNNYTYTPENPSEQLSVQTYEGDIFLSFKN